MQNNNYNTATRYENMGFVRYIMAFAVMIAHFNLFYGCDYWFPISSGQAVGGFFGLSGFLVYSSYQRHPDLKEYIRRRVARIVPSYSFIVILCGLLLCGLSTLSVGEYFSSPQLYKYIIANLVCLNFMQPELPGVFESNVVHAVNGSLWTIKIEWCLYLSVPIVVWLINRYKFRLWKTIAVIYLLSLIYKVGFHHMYVTTGSEIYQILGRQFFGQLLYFYWGVLLYFNINWVNKNRWYVVIACIVGLIVNRYSIYLNFLLEPMIVTTLAVIVSTMSSWGRLLNGSNNLSYDMYLYHFPIAQSLWVLLNGKIDTVYIFLIYCVLTVLLASVSWFGIGIRFKRPIPKASKAEWLGKLNLSNKC